MLPIAMGVLIGLRMQWVAINGNLYLLCRIMFGSLAPVLYFYLLMNLFYVVLLLSLLSTS